jgi:hypothetical protein
MRFTPPWRQGAASINKGPAKDQTSQERKRIVHDTRSKGTDPPCEDRVLVPRRSNHNCATPVSRNQLPPPPPPTRATSLIGPRCTYHPPDASSPSPQSLVSLSPPSPKPLLGSFLLVTKLILNVFSNFYRARAISIFTYRRYIKFL